MELNLKTEVGAPSVSVQRAIPMQESWATFEVDPALEDLYGELCVWIDALKNPPRQLVNDCHSADKRDDSMVAIRSATERYNEALAALVEAVYGKDTT